MSDWLMTDWLVADWLVSDWLMSDWRVVTGFVVTGLCPMIQAIEVAQRALEELDLELQQQRVERKAKEKRDKEVTSLEGDGEQAKRRQLQRVERLLPGSRGQDSAVTLLYVPSLLDSGYLTFIFGFLGSRG